MHGTSSHLEMAFDFCGQCQRRRPFEIVCFSSELQLEEHVCLTCSMYMSTLRTTHPRRLGSMAMQLYIRVLTVTLESFDSKILRKNKCLLLASQDCVIDARRRKVFMKTILRTVLLFIFSPKTFLINQFLLPRIAICLSVLSRS